MESSALARVERVLPLHAFPGNKGLVPHTVQLAQGWRGITKGRCTAAKVRRVSTLKVHASSKQTFSSFGEMIQKSDLPVLVDFYATWCGPCQYMVPILNEVGRKLKDKIRVVKVDTEKYPNVASRYGIQALPTFVLFRDGYPIDRLEGAVPAGKFIERIEDALSGFPVNASN